MTKIGGRFFGVKFSHHFKQQSEECRGVTSFSVNLHWLHSAGNYGNYSSFCTMGRKQTDSKKVSNIYMHSTSVVTFTLEINSGVFLLLQ